MIGNPTPQSVDLEANQRLFLGTPNNKAATMEKIAATAMSVKSSVIAAEALITSEDSSQRGGLRINLEQAASRFVEKPC